VTISTSGRDCVKGLLCSLPEDRWSIDDCLECEFVCVGRGTVWPLCALERIPLLEEMGLNGVVDGDDDDDDKQGRRTFTVGGGGGEWTMSRPSGHAGKENTKVDADRVGVEIANNKEKNVDWNGGVGEMGMDQKTSRSKSDDNDQRTTRSKSHRNTTTNDNELVHSGSSGSSTVTNTTMSPGPSTRRIASNEKRSPLAVRVYDLGNNSGGGLGSGGRSHSGRGGVGGEIGNNGVDGRYVGRTRLGTSTMPVVPLQPTTTNYNTATGATTTHNTIESANKGRRENGTVGTEHRLGGIENIKEHKKLSRLEVLYRNVRMGLETDRGVETRFEQLKLNHSDATSRSRLHSRPPHPPLFITKWIDYTNKYGLSYQFHNGSIGVYFNDGTSIILDPVGIFFEYLYYEKKEGGGRSSSSGGGSERVLKRQVWNVGSHPCELDKKCVLLNHFKSYMRTNLSGTNLPRNTTDSSSSSGGGGKIMGEKQPPTTAGLSFLTKYLRTKRGVLFRFSDGSVQVIVYN
jgi:hypothetical protein